MQEVQQASGNRKAIWQLFSLAQPDIVFLSLCQVWHLLQAGFCCKALGYNFNHAWTPLSGYRALGPDAV